MSNGSTVWVVQKGSGKDFSDAQRFGCIKELFEPNGISPFNVKALYEFATQRFLAESGPNDWLILTGNVPAIAAAAVAYQKIWGRLPLLVYHANRREYVEREVATGNDDKGDNSESKRKEIGQGDRPDART